MKISEHRNFSHSEELGTRPLNPMTPIDPDGYTDRALEKPAQESPVLEPGARNLKRDTLQKHYEMEKPPHSILSILLWVLFAIVFLFLGVLFFLPSNLKTEDLEPAVQVSKGQAAPEPDSEMESGADGEALPLSLKPDNITEELSEKPRAEMSPSPDSEMGDSPARKITSIGPSTLQPEKGGHESKTGKDPKRISPLSTVTPSGENFSSSLKSKQASSAKERKPEQLSSHPVPESKVYGTGYWIQVGAFTIGDNAEKLVKHLDDYGFSALIKRNKKNIYRVRMGIYPSKKEAARILKQVRRADPQFHGSIIIDTQL